LSRYSNSSGGGCATETSPELNTSRISLHEWPGLLNPALEASPRRDGHPSVHNVVAPASSMTVGQRADCNHWCLTGVPDAWNELLYAVIVNRFS
jgi:hypothetical protein